MDGLRESDALLAGENPNEVTCSHVVSLYVICLLFGLFVAHYPLVLVNLNNFIIPLWEIVSDSCPPGCW